MFRAPPVLTRRPVLIYDADCGFCRRWVSRLKRWDRRDAIELLPLTDPTAPALANRDQAALRLSAHLVLPSGQVFAGAAAARELCAFMPLGWLPGIVLRVPAALRAADRLYRWIARRWGPVATGARSGVRQPAAGAGGGNG
jgi:predicted DCC family thiol-disulfide oxidoreductase YuxK